MENSEKNDRRVVLKQVPVYADKTEDFLLAFQDLDRGFIQQGINRLLKSLAYSEYNSVCSVQIKEICDKKTEQIWKTLHDKRKTSQNNAGAAYLRISTQNKNSFYFSPFGQEIRRYIRLVEVAKNYPQDVSDSQAQIIVEIIYAPTRYQPYTSQSEPQPTIEGLPPDYKKAFQIWKLLSADSRQKNKVRQFFIRWLFNIFRRHFPVAEGYSKHLMQEVTGIICQILGIINKADESFNENLAGNTDYLGKEVYNLMRNQKYE